MCRNSKRIINPFRLGTTEYDISRYNGKLAVRVSIADVAGGRIIVPIVVGSPQSKESNERIEEKIDLIIKRLQEKDLEQSEKEQIAR